VRVGSGGRFPREPSTQPGVEQPFDDFDAGAGAGSGTAATGADDDIPF